MTIKELLVHQQQTDHVCLLRQGLFFRGYARTAAVLHRAMGYVVKRRIAKSGEELLYAGFPSIAFVVERPVHREVFAADFRDRIIHHLLMTLLIPHIESEFIYDSYACRPGRGTLFGVRRIRRFLAQCSEGDTKDCYVFKGMPHESRSRQYAL